MTENREALPSQSMRDLLLSDAAIEALTRHLQSEWAGPYMARVNDFTDEEIAAGELRKADDEAHEQAKAEARRGLEAVLGAIDDTPPNAGLDRDPGTY